MIYQGCRCCKINEPMSFIYFLHRFTFGFTQLNEQFYKSYFMIPNNIICFDTAKAFYTRLGSLEFGQIPKFGMEQNSLKSLTNMSCFLFFIYFC